MSRFRRSGRAGGARVEMGEAISFEDVLTIITVLLLLRLVFMVPLVNLDKAKTIAARADKYWSLQAAYILTNPSDTLGARPYQSAFGLQGKSSRVTDLDEGKVLFLEAVSPDSNVTVIKHNTTNRSFIAMNVAGKGHSLSFRHGTLIWSTDEGEWFPASDSIDYGTRLESKEMEKQFREWTLKSRGY